jgi:phosphatidylinositol alpha-1,6-mannosyltransferase
MKLVIVTQDLPPEVGGIQTYCSELARRFHRSLGSCVVLAPQVPDAERWDRHQPFRVIRCKGGSDALALSVVPELLALTSRGEVDIAFHAQWQTLAASAILRRLGRLRGLFVAAHGRELLLRPLTSRRGLQAGYDRLRRHLLRAPDCVFPVSHYTARRARALGVPARRCHVVPNGTDPEHFRPMPVEDLRTSLGLGGCPVLLFAGRLKANKGVDTVIAALPRIAREQPQVAFVIVGEGDDEPRLRALAVAHGVAERCRFLGRVARADLPRYYNLADVFVTLSREEPPSVEGFGLVFLEASACGRAVIGARSGGIPDAVVDGQTGVLVEPGNSDQFAEQALALLGDSALRTRLGEAGRAHVLDVGRWDAVHDRLLATMREAVGP